MKKLSITLLLVYLTFSYDRFEQLVVMPGSSEQKITMLTQEANKQFPEYSEQMIQYMLQKIEKENSLNKIDKKFLETYFRNFNEEMQNQLLKYYEVDHETEYIGHMKKNPEKYGLTFTAYKLLEF